MSSLDEVERCPNCGEPVRGVPCPGCGENPHTIDTVRCSKCGDRTAEADAVEVPDYGRLGMSGGTKHYCPECLDG